MHRRSLQVLALAVCLGLLPAAAYAKGGKGGGPPVDKGRSSSGHGFTDKDKDKHHYDNDRDQHYAGRGHGHDHEASARRGPSSRPEGWDKGKKTGWGDCNVPPGLAKKRGCDSRGLSTRERAAERARLAQHSTTARTPATSTSKVSRPGETRAIILQRDARKKREVQK